MTAQWYSRTVEQTRSILRTDFDRGLDRHEVKARRQKRGNNDIFALPRHSYRSYLSHLLTDIPTLMLLLTILIAVIFEERYTLILALCILLFYIVAAVAGFVRAQRVLDGMGERALPAAKVIREGKLYLIKQRHLVQGDVIFLSGGDIVPCDARLVESEDVECLETNLTSVARTVSKSARFVGDGDLAPSAQRNMVFASTIMTSGKAKAVVCEVGEDTLVCKMGKNKPIVIQDNLPILGALKQISRIWSICMMVMIFLLTGANLLLHSGTDLLDPFLTALSLSVAAMSEYYMPFGFLIVACGIYAAVRRSHGISAGAMIKDIGKLDTLRHLDCLLVPLQGVFTASDHKLESVYANMDLYETDHVGFARNASRAVRLALLSTGLYGEELRKNNLSGSNVYSGEEEAIIRAAESLSLYNTDLELEYPLLDHRSVGIRNDLETSIVQQGSGRLVIVRGSVGRVLSICTQYCSDGRTYSLDQTTKSELMAAAASIGKQSCRVVAVACGLTECDRIVRPQLVQRELTFEGFLAIREPILQGAAMNLQKCREGGIQVLLMADDEDENHITFARSLGLIEGEEEVLTGTRASTMKEGIFRVDAPNHRLFLGLNIAQKRLLLKSLHDRGRTVGVLAHQLDEIILYREADVGFAQSVTVAKGGGVLGVEMTSRHIPVFNREGKNSIVGCEALKFASDVIVSEATSEGEGGFNAIVRALMTAKSIFFNLNRAIGYLLATQSARLLLVVYALLTGISLLSPIQILYTGLAVDFLGVMMIAFLPPDRNVLDEPMPDLAHERQVWRYLVPHIFTVLVGVLWACACAALPAVLDRMGMPLTAEQTRTMTFYTFLCAQMVMLFFVGNTGRASFGRIRINRITLLSVLFEIAVPLCCVLLPRFGGWFDCTSLPSHAWIGGSVIVALLIIVCIIDRLLLKGRIETPKDTGGIYEQD